MSEQGSGKESEDEDEQFEIDDNVSVEDAPTHENVSSVNKPLQNKLEVKYASQKNCATFSFNNENHTLGNVLRAIASTDKQTKFVSYSLPHPAENNMELRLETISDSPQDVLIRSLTKLEAICQLIATKLSQLTG